MEQAQRIAARLSKKYPRHVRVEDLEAAGFAILPRAIRDYDPSRGANLKTYLHYRIFGAIVDEVRLIFSASKKTEPLPAPEEVRNSCRGQQAVEDRDAAEAILGRLPAREREVLWRRCLGDDQNSIGQDLGMTNSRVCQLQKRAIDRAKSYAPQLMEPRGAPGVK